MTESNTPHFRPSSSEGDTLISELSLEQQVAQRFIVGYQTTEGGQLPDSFKRFLNVGLGGVIFFRENFENAQHANDVITLMQNLCLQYPQNSIYPFLSLDQEGGQIERLGRHLFPSLVSPMSVGLRTQETGKGVYAAEVYDMLSFYLHQLGFNLNFTPTLDVNLEPNNPIIGVRSFGDDPNLVWRCGQIVLERLAARNIVAVGKHFPGHGEGTVDSHLALPELHYSEAGLAPFKQAIEFGLPAMMVAHGYYPELQHGKEPENTPASLSKTVIQDLLREQLNYSGLSISDDMCMGAITENFDAVEAAIKAFEAGIDVLIYKDSYDVQWQVLQGMVEALKSGRLDLAQHQQALKRVLKAKSSLEMPYPMDETTLSAKKTLVEGLFSTNALEANSALQAGQSVSVLMDDESIAFPISSDKTIGLIYPDLNTIHHYNNETHLPDLAKLFEAAEFKLALTHCYQPKQYSPLPAFDSAPDIVVVVSYDLHRDDSQIKQFAELQAECPDSKIILVSGNTPYEWQAVEGYAIHIALCSLRQQSLKALVQWLNGELN